MKNLADEIPQRAFINARILQTVVDSEAFEYALKNVTAEYGIYNYDFMNQAYVAGLLYCLLVVPRQLFVEGQEIYLDKRLPPDVIKCYFTLKRADPNVVQSSSQFLRKLRNSVAHARFLVDEHMNFVFRDGRPEIDFEAEASARNLMTFISEIGAVLANLRPVMCQ